MKSFPSNLLGAMLALASLPAPAGQALHAGAASAPGAVAPTPRSAQASTRGAARIAPQPASASSVFRVAIDTGRKPAGPQGQAEFALNQSLGGALARALAAHKVVVALIPTGLTPTQRAQAAAGSQLLVSVNHEVFAAGQSQQARGTSGFTLAVSTRQSSGQVVALHCARRIGQALVAAGRTSAAAMARPLMDVALGVQRQDDLTVLNAAPVPALRLQAAVLANPTELQRTRSHDWLDSQAQAVAKGVLGCLGSAADLPVPPGPDAASLTRGGSARAAGA